MNHRGPSVLRVLQQELEALHGVDTQLHIDDYSIDHSVRSSIPEAIDGLVEQLFIRDDGDSLEIALYVAPPILQRLQRENPHTYLHPGNFEDFCVALEGVSHFVFLAWRADLGRPVTALELELQAEVDKFLFSWLWVLAGRAHPNFTADSLLSQLFDHYALREELPLEQHERYAVASRAAHNICRWFVHHAGPKPNPPDILRAARRYLRRGLSEKLRVA